MSLFHSAHSSQETIPMLREESPSRSICTLAQCYKYPFIAPEEGDVPYNQDGSLTIYPPSHAWHIKWLWNQYVVKCQTKDDIKSMERIENIPTLEDHLKHQQSLKSNPEKTALLRQHAKILTALLAPTPLANKITQFIQENQDKLFQKEMWNKLLKCDDVLVDWQLNLPHMIAQDRHYFLAAIKRHLHIQKK